MRLHYLFGMVESSSMIEMPESEQSYCWYCLQSQPKKEHIAARFLSARAGLEAFAPRISYIKNTRTGKKRFTEALFPGYLFVHCSLKLHNRLVGGVEGVRGFLRYGNFTPTMPDSLIADLKTHLGDEPTPLASPALVEGMNVTIVDGPFANFEAVIKGELPGKDRVRVLLDFLGNTQEVTIQPDQLQPRAYDPRTNAWGKSSNGKISE